MWVAGKSQPQRRHGQSPWVTKLCQKLAQPNPAPCSSWPGLHHQGQTNSSSSALRLPCCPCTRAPFGSQSSWTVTQTRLPLQACFGLADCVVPVMTVCPRFHAGSRPRVSGSISHHHIVTTTSCVWPRSPLNVSLDFDLAARGHWWLESSGHVHWWP